MKKSRLKLGIIITVLTLFSYLVYKVIDTVKKKDNIAKRIQTIPNFELLTLEERMFNNSNLKHNTSIIFIYFNSECDFCQHEAKNISENLEEFKGIQLLFVSTEAVETIKKFAASYNLLNQPNITFLNDNTYSFTNRFDANHIPYILIYNSKQELLKKHKGQLNAEAILKVLQ